MMESCLAQSRKDLLPVPHTGQYQLAGRSLSFVPFAISPFLSPLSRLQKQPPPILSWCGTPARPRRGAESYMRSPAKRYKGSRSPCLHDGSHPDRQDRAYLLSISRSSRGFHHMASSWNPSVRILYGTGSQDSCQDMKSPRIRTIMLSYWPVIDIWRSKPQPLFVKTRDIIETVERIDREKRINILKISLILKTWRLPARPGQGSAQ